MKLIPIVLGAAVMLSVGAAIAQPNPVFNLRGPGLRHYWGYPYYYSWGARYDPYWSYKSSYYPELYGGDGSYYGMGYSGYAGNNWYGSYWYW